MTESGVARVLRKDLKLHLTNDCPRRKQKCAHCKKYGEHYEITTTHLDTCPKVRVNCPNTDCGEKVARCDIPSHLTTCEYQSISCKYAAVGCGDKPLRKDLLEHQQNDQLHLRAISEKVLDLTKINSHLVMSNSIIPCTFKLTDFQGHKRANKVFHSPPFYTSKKGYKMCLNVRATNIRVAVFACLMKGEYDDTLTWPFTGTVTVELLNQLDDANHYEKTFLFVKDSENDTRVVDCDMRKRLGLTDFILHAALKNDASANTQYLKNDTLVFKVSVEDTPDQKAWWLECTM